MARRLRASTETPAPADRPVRTVAVDPQALSIALGIADGDRRLLEISNDGMSITVRNRPTRR